MFIRFWRLVCSVAVSVCATPLKADTRVGVTMNSINTRTIAIMKNAGWVLIKIAENTAAIEIAIAMKIATLFIATKNCPDDAA